MSEIREQWNLDAGEATLRSRLINPGQVSERRINGTSDHLGVHVTELFNAVREGDDLRWTHESAVRIDQESATL